MQEGRGVKEVWFNQREVKMDGKSGSVIIPPYYRMLTHNSFLFSFSFSNLFAGINEYTFSLDTDTDVSKTDLFFRWQNNTIIPEVPCIDLCWA